MADPSRAPLYHGQPHPAREELDVVEGQSGDFLGRVSRGRHQQNPVSVQVQVAGIELAHQPAHEHGLRSRREDRPVIAFDACPQLRRPVVHHGQVVADIERTDLTVGKSPQQIGRIGPAVLSRVAALLRQCPALIEAGLRAVHPPPGRTDESALVFAGVFVDLLGAARRHA